MSKKHPDRLRNVLFCLVAALVVLADLLSKTWIRTNLQTGQVIFDTGLFRITNIHNTGAAFGILQNQQLLLTLIASIGIPAVLLSQWFARRYLPFLADLGGGTGLGLVLGGTIGNLTDRLRFGYVTDFIDFRVWPTFNVADASITCGILVIAYCLLRASGAEKHHDEQSHHPDSG